MFVIHNLKCNCILGDGDSIVCVPLWLKHLQKFRQDMKDKEPCLLVSNGSKLKKLQHLFARDAPEYMEDFNRELDKCLREKIYINVGNTDGREITTFLISKNAKMAMLFDAYMKHHGLGGKEGFTFHDYNTSFIAADETPEDFFGAGEGRCEASINIYNKKHIVFRVNDQGESALTFHMNIDMTMGTLFTAYTHKRGVDKNKVIFHYNGEHIEANNTPRDLLQSYNGTLSRNYTINCSEADLSIGASDCVDIYLNEKTISFLKQNDHRFTSLIVENELYLNPPTHCVDWISDGMSAIGNNTSLKRVAFSRLYFDNRIPPKSNPEVFYAFCRALASNRSIESFEIDDRAFLVNEYGTAMFNILSTFFEHNSNLRCIDISGSMISGDCLGNANTHSLASALSKCTNSSLSDISISGLEEAVDEVRMFELISALNNGYHNIVNLSLGHVQLGVEACTALGGILTSPNSRLKKLYLSHSIRSDEGAASIARGLAANDSVTVIEIRGIDESITASGWLSFSSILQDADAALSYEKFTFCGNRDHPSTIGDGALTAMVEALGRCSKLTCLRLDYLPSISSTGWQSLSALLEHPDSVLKNLYVCVTPNLNDEVAIAWSKALAKNTSLKTINTTVGHSITSLGWKEFKNALCNPSSISAIYESNHTLEEIGIGGSTFSRDRDRWVPSEDLIYHLEINRNFKYSIERVPHCKIILYLHLNFERYAHEFEDMTILPNVLACISTHKRRTMYEGDSLSVFSARFQVVRSSAGIFDSDKKRKSTGKRKRAQVMINDIESSSSSSQPNLGSSVESQQSPEELFLFKFLESQQDCIKGSANEFGTWIKSEGIDSISDLKDAVCNEFYLKTMINGNGSCGLMLFKSVAFKLAVSNY